MVDCGWTARSLLVISWTVRDLDVSGSVCILPENMAFGNKVAKSINSPEIIFSFVLGGTGGSDTSGWAPGNTVQPIYVRTAIGVEPNEVPSGCCSEAADEARV